MADDVAASDCSGIRVGDSADSESDKVPSTVSGTGRLPAPAGSCILRMGLACFTGTDGMQDADANHRRKELDRRCTAVCDAIPSDPSESTCQWRQLRLKQLRLKQ